MNDRALNFSELIGLIVILAGLVWLIITLSQGAIKERLREIERQIVVLFLKGEENMTKEDCDKNMKNCKELREAQANHDHGKKHSN